MRLPALAAVLLLSACAATPVMFEPSGGSRADGVVELSYQYRVFQKPKVSFDQALDAANQTCAAWGYTGSRPFQGEQTQCVDDTPNCGVFVVSVRFQCTGHRS